MRIIAGSLKGRKLRTPKNSDVRPTTDKVREAVFSMLLPYMYDGFVAVDLFSGSGAMGLEAVSRGAGRVYFSDSSRESLALTRENAAICGVSDKAVLLSGDFRTNVRRIREQADVIFLDPPYAEGYILPALDAILDSGLLAEGGVCVCEHAQRDSLPESYRELRLVRDRRYGAIGVSIYELAAESSDAEERESAPAAENAETPAPTEEEA